MEKINLRKLLAGTAALTIVAPTTVGILSSIGTNRNAAYERYQQVINHISAATYAVQTTAGNDPKSVSDQITFKFIQEQLDDEYKDTFRWDLFYFNKVLIGNRDLNVKDLKEVKIFTAHINYNYGSITGVTTDLEITVTEPDPIEKKIVEDINNATYELPEIPIKTTVNTIKGLITSDFIKTNLSAENKDLFDFSLFQLTKITENGHDLEDSRLELAQTLYTKLHYDYGNIKNQETLLMIYVVGVDPEQIAFAISQASYEQEVVANSTVADLEAIIDGSFMQAGLEDQELHDAFDSTLLKFDVNKITVNGNKLTDEDLKEPKIITANINYSYGAYQNYKTNFKIIIVA